MTEMYMRYPGSRYSACWSFTKSKAKIQKFKETGDPRYIYKNDLEKVCFQHDMGYGNLMIYQEEQLLTKYYVKRHLLVIQ